MAKNNGFFQGYCREFLPADRGKPGRPGILIYKYIIFPATCFRHGHLIYLYIKMLQHRTDREK